jgi:DNA-binding MarR family transcriptional regulator
MEYITGRAADMFHGNQLGGWMVTDFERVFSELVRLETELWNAADARLRTDFDLPLSRYEPMRVIDRRGSCRIHDIAAELVITIGGTSKLIDRIEASGLCRRRPNPEDGRSSIIELTPSGKRLLAKAKLSLDDELNAHLGAVLSPRTLEQFAATLTKLRAADHHGGM